MENHLILEMRVSFLDLEFKRIVLPPLWRMDSSQDRETGDQSTETIVTVWEKMNRAVDGAEEKGRDSRVIKEAELRGLGDCVGVCAWQGGVDIRRERKRNVGVLGFQVVPNCHFTSLSLFVCRFINVLELLAFTVQFSEK